MPKRRPKTPTPPQQTPLAELHALAARLDATAATLTPEQLARWETFYSKC